MVDLIHMLFSRGWRMDLGLPDDVTLNRQGVEALLQGALDVPKLSEAKWAKVMRLAGFVAVERESWCELECLVGDDTESALLALAIGHAQSMNVWCSRCAAGAECLHVVAVLVAVAYADERVRPLMSRSPWQHFIRRVLEADEEPTPATKPPRPGWLRAVLHTEPSRERSAVLFDRLTVSLMHRSKNGKKVLKPRALPRNLAALDRVASGLRSGERALVGRIDDLRTLVTARSGYGRSHDPGEGILNARDRCQTEILELLAEVTELYLDDRPIAFDATPWQPRLVATDDPAGGLAMRWSARPQLVFPLERAYAVVDDRLRPVVSTVSLEMLQMVLLEPPAVPPGEVSAFVDLMIGAPPGALAPIELDTTALPVERHPPAPRLLLSADGQTLHVGLRFGYGTTECGADDPEVVHDAFAERPRFIRRDPPAERALWRRMGEIVAELPERPTALSFRGEAAFAFLEASADALADFEVITDESLDLTRWRPRGTLSVQAALSGDLDWFDLDIQFTCAERDASAEAVLESWRAGRRYLRLDDGGLARLPDAWLARHGETLGELGELGELRGRRRRVGAFAAPIVADLLEEVELDTAGAQATAESLRALAGRVADFEGIPDRPAPEGLQATLRDYQHRGYRWIRALAELGLSGVLADDMGLGKTVQTLAALLDAHRDRPGPSLVVAPTSVIHNWVLEAARFAPTLRVALFYGPKRGALPTDVDVVITSYALLRLDREALGAVEWHYVVLDEAQHIKNPVSKTARAARALRARHRLALSGTPLSNHLIELWSIFEFVMPGFFGGRDAFRRRYVEPIQRSEDPERRSEALARLRQRIRPFVLRRLKQEVATELPSRQEQLLWCELSRPERRLYDAVKQTYRSTVLERVDAVGVARATIVILEALTRLRQAACDAALLPFPEARDVRQSAKRSRLLETVSALAEGGHRALVFSQWPSLLKRVAADLDGAGLTYQYLDGSTRDRADLQARWNAPDGPPVFLISLKAGGTGLNLIGADVVIHLDPWWNPQTEQQATDRAHRIGQTRPVMVYKMVARDTVEEMVLELQARKRALFEATVDGDRATVDGLTRADLEAVFGDDGRALPDRSRRRAGASGQRPRARARGSTGAAGVTPPG